MARDNESIRKEKLTFDQLDEHELEVIREATVTITQLGNERDAINARMNSERKRIKAIGIDLDGWRASKRRLEMDPDDRAKFDHSFEQANIALRIPIPKTLV